VKQSPCDPEVFGNTTESVPGRMVGIAMTKDALRKSCERDGLYRTARLNEKLFLHYKGWERVENLEEYTDLKVLWLEGNGLVKIEGLEAQKQLRTLYLQENVLEKIENLENQVHLDTLNLAQNFISRIENLGHMKELKTLMLPQNKLKDLDGVHQVTELPELTCLDVQKNEIEDPEIISLLEQCPKLAVLYLQGNPCVKQVRFYRKSVIFRLKNLKYLDDRPVFPEERLRAEAWCNALKASGGNLDAARKAETEEVERQKLEKKAKEDANFLAFERMMESGRKSREAHEAQENIAQNIMQQQHAPTVPPVPPLDDNPANEQPFLKS